MLSKITESELQVLQFMWQSQTALTLAQIKRGLKEQTGWEDSTVKTLLYRLCDKGAVLSEKQEVLYYSPAVSEGDYTAYATEHIVRKLYGGNAKKLVASLLTDHSLTREDISELRAMFKAEDRHE